MTNKNIFKLSLIIALFAIGQSFCFADSIVNRYKNASQSTKVQAISNLKKAILKQTDFVF